MELERCNVCEAEFGAGHLGEDGICATCKKIWPGAKTKEDRNKGKKPDVENQEILTKELITKRLNEMLVEHGILHKCECGSFFYKRSPAQRGCGKCPKKVDKNKATKLENNLKEIK